MELQKEVERLNKVIKNLEQKIYMLEADRNEPADTKNEANYTLDVNTQKYKFVTILYSDVKGLTELAQKNDAETLIDELDRFYFYFDTVLEKYNIQRIKSIGDTYLCAGGFPFKEKTNPINVVMVALEMQTFLRKIQQDAKKRNFELWDITFGIHSGPVQVNKYGKRKIVYELSGDSLNIASRIESACKLGEISISAKTYDMVKDFFVCQYKGRLPVKYKGELSLYTVTGYKKELSVNQLGLEPNIKFMSKLQMLAYEDVNEKLVDFLEKNLDKQLKFYDIKHSVDVAIAVEIIASTENITEEDILLLKAAAIFHDAGIAYGYKNHEFSSVEIAKKFLKPAGFSDQQMKIIEQLILVTHAPFNAKNLLEQVICDADLEYLGKPDFIEILNDKFFDISLFTDEISHIQWLDYNRELIIKYDFYTDSAKNLCFTTKEEQLIKIDTEISKYNKIQK